MLGALALGSHVAGTLKSGIAVYSCFQAEPSLYMIGMTSALGAAAAWLIFASFAGLPVSATHSIVGGIVGMALVLKGTKCVNWGMTGVGKIAISWITSPLLAGIAAFFVYTLVKRVIFGSKVAFSRSLRATPILLAVAVSFLEMLTFWDFVKPWWAKLLLFLGSPLLVYGIVTIFGIPYLRNAISTAYTGMNASYWASNGSSDSLTGLTDDAKNTSSEYNVEMEEISRGMDTDTAKNDVEDGIVAVALEEESPLGVPDAIADPTVTENDKATQVFWYLQNFTACFGSFAHGANDTANTIGPFAAVFHLWREGVFQVEEPVPLWIVAIGGCSIVLGLAILGYRVIQTMGKEIIHVDYVSGFSSELSSSITVVIASRLQIPVSSTHCQVGAIVGVGLVESKNNSIPADDKSANDIENNTNRNEGDESEKPPYAPDSEADALDNSNSMPKTVMEEIKERLGHIQWKSVGKIFISWMVTVPVSALVSALLAIILKQTIKVKA